MSLLGDILGFQDAGRAGKSISDGYDVATTGLNQASQHGQDLVDKAYQGATQLSQHGLDQNYALVGQGTADANKTLADTAAGQTKILTDYFNGQKDNLNPYLSAGSTGLSKLTDYVNGPDSKFSFKPEDYFNSPAYQFQLGQGQSAIENSASARGLGSSGAALKDLTTFGQGLASTYYNDAFNRAKSTFDTNQNATLSNLSTLIQSGEYGTGQFDTASQNAGNQISNAQQNAGNRIANNDTTSAYYLGDKETGQANLLAHMGMNAAQFNSNTGTDTARTTGGYQINKGYGRAGTILNQGKIVNQGLDDVGGLLQTLLGMGGG